LFYLYKPGRGQCLEKNVYRVNNGSPKAKYVNKIVFKYLDNHIICIVAGTAIKNQHEKTTHYVSDNAVCTALPIIRQTVKQFLEIGETIFMLDKK
jgi:hypothetical protein